MAEARHFDEAAFDEALAQPGVLVVDFWATWCMPCKMMAPIVDKLADKYAGRAVVGKVDIDEEPDLAARYNVQSIPTIAVFKDGKPVETLVGARPVDAFVTVIDRLLG